MAYKTLNKTYILTNRNLTTDIQLRVLRCYSFIHFVADVDLRHGQWRSNMYKNSKKSLEYDVLNISWTTHTGNEEDFRRLNEDRELFTIHNWKINQKQQISRSKRKSKAREEIKEVVYKRGRSPLLFLDHISLILFKSQNGRKTFTTRTLHSIKIY